MQGAADDVVRPRPVPARAAVGWPSPVGRTQYLPARVAADAHGLTVRPAARLGSASHLVGSLATANGYAVVAAERTEVAAGDLVDTVVTEP
jgi:molybdopterin molybdotransferase